MELNFLTNPLFYAILASSLLSIINIFGLFLSIYSIIEVKALKRSTHSVQYVPIDTEIDKANEDFIEKWATSEEVIEDQEKRYKEELEEEMPTLYSKDNKRYSF